MHLLSVCVRLESRLVHGHVYLRNLGSTEAVLLQDFVVIDKVWQWKMLLLKSFLRQVCDNGVMVHFGLAVRFVLLSVDKVCLTDVSFTALVVASYSLQWCLARRLDRCVSNRHLAHSWCRRLSECCCFNWRRANERASFSFNSLRLIEAGGFL